MLFPVKHLEQLSHKHNLNLFALQNVKQTESILKESANKLKIWQAQGYSAEMSYMQRDVSLYASLSNILPVVKSILTFIFPYQNKTENAHLPRLGFGRVAKYAWGEDYHEVIKGKLLKFVAELEQGLPKSFIFEYRVFSDAVPILERALAANSELGFIGKNSMLIRPNFGSYFFIAEVLCNLEFDEEKFNFSPARIKAKGEYHKAGSGCGECESCKVNCPTNAIVADGVINSERCISYLTIEKKSQFSNTDSVNISDWIFGCDICQDVCPFNLSEKEIFYFDEFTESRGVGPYLNLLEVLQIKDNSEFKKFFGHTALKRAGRDKLLRNACAVVANTKYQKAKELIWTLSEEDSSEMVREEAKRSLELI